MPTNCRHPLRTLKLLTAENAETGAKNAENPSIIHNPVLVLPTVTWLLALSAISGFSPRSLRFKALEVF